MDRPFVLKMLESHYCKLVFAASLLLAYQLTPKKVFVGWYSLLGLAFMVNFAFVLTCTVRQIKERTKLAFSYKGTTLGTIATAIGLAGLQVCGVGAPVCGAAVGSGFLSFLFPVSASGFMEKYAVPIIIASILLQSWALFSMNCFKKCSSKVLLS